MNKDIQKVWRYAALQWHNVTTKHPEKSVNYFPMCGGWMNDSTELHAIHVLKNSPSFVEIAFIYSRKLSYKKGKIYRATADPLNEYLDFSPAMGLAALDPIFNV
jgi:hypothetical protein